MSQRKKHTSIFYDVIPLFESVQGGGSDWKPTNLSEVLHGWSLFNVLHMGILLCSPLKFGICDISYTKFYEKFNVLYKFYPATLFHYSWNNNLIMFLHKRNIWVILINFSFVLLLSHFLVNISTTNNDKVFSILFSQRQWIYVDSTLLFNQISTLKQHWIINIEST